jgi:hypothetical protein
MLRLSPNRSAVSAAAALAVALVVPAAAFGADPLSGLTWSQAYAWPGQNLVATYSASRDSTVSFSILNSSGQRVRDLGDDVPVGAGSHAVDWEGYADDTTPVPDGIYRLVLDARDGDGAPSSLSAPITIDAHAPTARLVSRRLTTSSRLVITLRDNLSGLSYASARISGRLVAHVGPGAQELRYRLPHRWKPGVYAVTIYVRDVTGNAAYLTRKFRVVARARKR